jgi:hypothetical protein
MTDDLRVTITVYPDLTAAESFLYSWLPHFTFVPDPTDSPQRVALAGLAGVEVRFPADCDLHKRYLSRLLTSTGRAACVVLVEHRSEPRSRVRSYKGLLAESPAIKAGEYQQLEQPLTPPYTHLAAIARVTASNVSECVAIAQDGARSFCLLSNAPVRSLRALGETALRCVPGLPGPASLNYAPLIAALCASDAWVVRMGGGGRDGERDVQLFVPRDDLVKAERLAEMVIGIVSDEGGED